MCIDASLPETLSTDGKRRRCPESEKGRRRRGRGRGSRGEGGDEGEAVKRHLVDAATSDTGNFLSADRQLR